MGCKESTQRDAGDSDPAWNGSNFRDPFDSSAIGPAEEKAHIAAWKDNRIRQRIENTLKEECEATAEQAKLSMSLHLRDDQAIERNNDKKADEPASRRCDTDSNFQPPSGKIHSPAREEGHVIQGTGLQASSQGVETLEEKKRRIEKLQAKARREQMLNLDPSCWKALAGEQRYQFADDLLREAQKVEQDENGR